MRREWVLLVLAAGLAAQQPPSPALIRGVLLERDPQTGMGEFSVRGPDNQVFRYRFDGKTYVEREEHMIEVSRLEPGEKVEVLSDEGPASTLRYARTVHVLQTPPPARPQSLGRLRAYRSSMDRSIPTGNLTYSGVVSRLNPERLVLHTRGNGDQTILLRQDTRYLENGGVAGAADLKPNMRVFVRAGKNIYDEVEAYQVVWGQILEP